MKLYSSPKCGSPTTCVIINIFLPLIQSTSTSPRFSCSDTGAPEGGTEAVQIGSMKDQKKDRVPTGSGGMAAFYNSSTGIQTIKNRGGYSNSESQDLQLDGPGMLYTAHLDVEPRDDYIEVTDAGGHSVRLTGNYSACIQARTGLESIYMDKNLAPGTHYSESNDDYHNTEETQVRRGAIAVV